jgi:hypothetical protein
MNFNYFKFNLILLTFSLFIFQLNAQNFHALETPVFENGQQFANPWVGGMNAPQWSSFDINNDGKKDLYAFDRNGNVHLSFINTDGTPGATDYKSARFWLNNFPTGQNFVMMRDYNRDGVADMFVSAFDEGLPAFKVYKGRFQNGQLFFERILFPEFNYDVIPFMQNGQVVNWLEIYNNPDYPAIDDIDGDGDLDILTMNPGANKVLWYKNIALESGFTDEVLMYELADDCWGRFGVVPFSPELVLSTDMELCTFFTDPDNVDDRVHGGTTLCTFDNDNDGDKEILYGDLIYPNIIFGENAGTPTKAWMNTQDANFPSNDVPVDITDFPASYHVDVNNDGARDLLFSPNQPSESPDINTVWWYENIGTDELPEFQFIKNDFLSEGILDFGTGALPVFWDVNADGLIDIIVGNKEEFSDSIKNSYLILLLNIGTEIEPQFEVVDRNWLGLSQYNSETWAFAPAFGDLDSDGDDDLLIGDRQGFVHYFENIAGAGQPMEFAAPQFIWKNINVGSYSTPFIHDINKDGLLDLLIGERNGTVNYFPNIGSETQPDFYPIEEEAPNNNFFGKINTQFNGSPIGYSQPIVIEFDQTSYVFSGTDAGWIMQYEINQDSLESGSFKLITDRFGNLREGFATRISFADINKNNDYLEAIVGNDRGGVTLFQSPLTIDGLVNEEEAIPINEDLIIYPNPTSQVLFIKSENDNLLNSFDYEIINSFGQKIMIQHNYSGQSIDVGSIPVGVYFLLLKTKSKAFNIKFIKS